MILVHSVAWIVAVLLLIAVVRQVGSRAKLIAVIIVAGIVARAVVGFGLFWISLHHMPIMQSLQLGDGFWHLAPDGLMYYKAAQFAAQHGVGSVSSASPSPAYVRLLAVSLLVFGDTPLTALVINVIAYSVSCALCVALWPSIDSRPRQTCAVAVIALSFSPSLFLASTQVLKDQLFALFVVGTSLAMQRVLGACVPSNRGRLSEIAFFSCAAAVALFEIGGIRPYYGVLVVGATAAVLAASTFALPIRRWASHLAGAAAVIGVLWMAFVTGSGAYAERYNQFVFKLLGIPIGQSSFYALAEPFDMAREGFIQAGGGTNIIWRRTRGGTSLPERLEDEALGMMVLVLPISVLKESLDISVSGGRGLLGITDVDTVFLDLTLVAQVYLLMRFWRPETGNAAFLAFSVLLAVAVMLPMAYVVTNYGTLFRLRLMYAMPLWLAGAALGRRASALDARRRVDAQLTVS